MKETKVPEFKKYLKQAGHLKYDDEQFIKHQVIIKAQDYNRDSAIIADVDFQGGLTFDSTGDLGAGIILKNCKGLHLFVSGCEISAVSENLGYPNGSGLILDNCQFKVVRIINNFNFKRGLTIRNGSKIKDLEISHSNFTEDDIEINNSQITERLRIEYVKSNLGLTINGTKINCGPSILGVSGGSMTIQKSQIDKEIFIVGCDANINLNESNFDDDFNLQSCAINSFTSYGDKFKKGLLLDTKHYSIEGKVGFINNINIKNTSTDEGIVFNGYKSVIDKLEINCTNILSGSFKFDDFKLENCNISGLNKNSHLTFSSCKIETLLIENFYNQSGLTFSHCKAASSDSVFEIDSSDLGNTLFIDFDFTGFLDIAINDSIVSDSRISGGKLFNADQLYNRTKSNKDDIFSKTEYFQFTRDIFRQFRSAAVKQGDSILAYNLKAKELTNYWEQLRSSKKWWQRDRLMLALSSTNDMGLNWAKPLWFLLGVTFFFYFPTLICASPELNFSAIWSSNRIDWCGSFWQYLDNSYLFLLMLNPARMMNRIFVDPPIDSNWIYLWDTLHRIILAFLIFQILTAFRKYIK